MSAWEDETRTKSPTEKSETYECELSYDVEFTITGAWATDPELKETFDRVHSLTMYRHLVRRALHGHVFVGNNVPFAILGPESSVLLYVPTSAMQGRISWHVKEELR